MAHRNLSRVLDFVRPYPDRVSNFLDAHLGAAKGRILANLWKILGVALFGLLLLWRTTELQDSRAQGALTWSETHGPSPQLAHELFSSNHWRWLPYKALPGYLPPPRIPLEDQHFALWQDRGARRLWIEWGGTALRAGFALEKVGPSRKTAPQDWVLLGKGWAGIAALDSLDWPRLSESVVQRRKPGIPRDPREFRY